MRRLLALAPALVALTMALPAAAQQQGNLSRQDRTFAEKAAIGGMAEVQMGQLAKDKAQNTQVQQFGQRMVDDHGQANQKLQQIAQGKNIDLPTKLDDKHQAKMREMQKLTGARFDQNYMRDMVKDHQEDIAAFEKEASQGKDADLKQFAQQTLPTLREHLTLAKQTEAALGNQMSSRQHNGNQNAGSSSTMKNPGGSAKQ